MNYYPFMVLTKNFSNFITSTAFGNIKELEEVFEMEDVFCTGLSARTCLHQVLTAENLRKPISTEIIHYLVKKGVPINVQDASYGMTPLHYAIEWNNIPVALVLLDYGADPNIPSFRNMTPLARVGRKQNYLEVLEKMLEAGGNVHYPMYEDETILQSFEKAARRDSECMACYQLMLKYA